MDARIICTEPHFLRVAYADVIFLIIRIGSSTGWSSLFVVTAIIRIEIERRGV